MTTIILIPDEPKLDPATFRRALPDYEIVPVPAGDPTALAEAPDATAIVAHTNTPIPESVFEAHPNLQILARLGTGVDNIDVDAAAAHDVVVTNVPEYSTDEVATHALSLLLAVRRSLLEHDRAVASGDWDWTVGAPAPPLVGSTVGVVSFGSIAQRFVELLEGFDVDVLVYDPYVDDETIVNAGARRVDFDGLLEAADAVSIHAPLTPETAGMFDADAFARLPDHAVVVNVGRGGIIDQADLRGALEAGSIAGAGLDVFETEPPTDVALLERGDVVCTPHSAWYSSASRQRLNETAARNVAAALAGEQPPDVIPLEADWIA